MTGIVTKDCSVPNIPDNVLGGESDKVVGWVVDLAIGRHGSSGSKRTTGATLSLIPDICDDTLVSPVH